MKKYLVVVASSNNKITKHLDFENKSDADAFASSRSGAFVVETPENKRRYWVVDADKKTVTFDKSTHDADVAKATAVAYKKQRRNEYPEIGDQLDDLYRKGVFSDEMAAQLKAVKDKYPKE